MIHYKYWKHKMDTRIVTVRMPIKLAKRPDELAMINKYRWW